nr:alcohol dehydrogenase catalytic domain-containing protein [Candidatus Sigynarchaeota archaeon]
MKALVLDAYGLQFKANYPDPKVGGEDVLVRVKAVGICGTDVAIVNETLKAPKPIIPGHEITGIIEKTGDNVPNNVKALVGKLVTTEINTNTCGKCWFCNSGVPTQCPHRKALGIDVNGGMAEFIAVRHDLVHVLPEGLDPKEGTFIEPLAAAVQTFEMMPLGDGDRKIAIIGAGKLGLLVLQVLVAKYGSNCEVMVIDHHDFKLELAMKFGASRVLNASSIPETTLINEINAFSRNLGVDGVDVMIEATGNPRALNQAIYATRARGKIALKSTHGVPVPFDLTVAVVKEISFFTSRCGPFDKAIDYVKA